MTLDQRITQAAARVAIAWRNGEEDQAAEWQAEVERLMDQRDRDRAELAHAFANQDAIREAAIDEIVWAIDHADA